MMRSFSLFSLLTVAHGFNLVGQGPLAVAQRALPARLCAAAQSGLESIDDESYEAVVISESVNRPVLVDFCTDWCGPCKLVEPLLKEIHAKGEVKVVKAKPEDTEGFRAWLAKQGKHIAGLPTCILIENGVPSRLLEGAFNAAKLQNFLGTRLSDAISEYPALDQLGTTLRGPRPRTQLAYSYVRGTDTDWTSPHERWAAKPRGHL